MTLNFSVDVEIEELLAQLDEFIDGQIRPLEVEGGNARFFDHRREWARTDFENQGLPRPEWEALLGEMTRRADKAGFLRLALPKEYGGREVGNLVMAFIRQHLARRGIGLHNDLQTETAVVGNFPYLLFFRDFGSAVQKEQFIPGMLDGSIRCAFGLTEPKHGSDATWMETRAIRRKDEWVINGAKMWNTGVHTATHDLVFCRTAGDDGDAQGLSCFIVPMESEGVKIEEYMWTFNMPTDHGRVSFKNVVVGQDALLGPLDNGLLLARRFVQENRIRQAASSLGAAEFCIDASVQYANTRAPFGKRLSANQAIQWPLVDLQTEAEMLKWLIRSTAWELDRLPTPEAKQAVSDKVSMCNYRANRLACNAADWAIQIHGGLGYSRHMPFEHIYRHHRRYRITEGSDEIQIRNVAGHLFGFVKSQATA